MTPHGVASGGSGEGSLRVPGGPEELVPEGVGTGRAGCPEHHARAVPSPGEGQPQP